MGQSYLKNAALLTGADVLLRLAGMGLRIYLANALGGEGMGLYQLVLAVYALFVTLATAGVSVAATRLMAEELARGRAQARGMLVRLAGLLFGPGAGFAVGAVADIIGGVLAGYAINPLITLGAGAIGLVAGYAWQKLPDYRTGLRLSISVLLGHFVGSMVINSLALRIFYGYAWSVLLARIPNALVLSAVNTVLLRILLENRSLMKLAKK